MDTLSVTPRGTRSRSRSKTPFLRSSCDRETCRKLGEGHTHDRNKSKSPSKRSPIHTIIEEEIGEYQQQRQSKQIQRSVKEKITKISSDYSSNDSSSPESSFRIQQKTITTKSHSLNDTRNNNEDIHHSGVGGDGITNYSLNNSPASTKIKESKRFEGSTMKTSTPIGISSKESICSNNKNGDLSNNVAYKEYKEAGEYWKKYPKTDYTYSKLSPHRREIIPGVIAMPNMSRRSLEKHRERVDVMIQKNPTQETYIRQRYQPTTYPESIRQSQEEQQQLKQQYLTDSLLYSSEDEVDYLSKYRKTKFYSTTSLNSVKRTESLIVRIMNRIVTFFSYLTSFFWVQNDYHRIERIQDHQQGILQCFKSVVTTSILKIITAFYLVISSILYLDLCILKSPPNAAKSKKRRFRLFLLIFLPLLLLGICYYISYPDKFPPIVSTFSKMKIPSMNLNLTQFINSENIDLMKMNAINKIDNLKTWSEDYFSYLKTVSQNIAFEAQKIWLENFNN